MDKIFASFSEKSFSKKAVIIVLGSVFFLIFLAASYFLTTPSANNSKNDSSRDSQATLSPFQTPSSVLPQNKSVVYNNSYFAISYPESYSYQEGTIPGGGTSLILKPSQTNSFNTVIEIQTYNPSAASQSAIEDVFTALGYQKSQTTAVGIAATQFTGLTSNAGVSLRENAIIFTYQNRVYKLQLTYSGAKENKDIELTFNKIVSSFKPSFGY